MRIPLFQIDAFTGRVFGGNPAAVCPLGSWPDDAILQAIAAENNLSETAFLSGGGGRYKIRWFTPQAEVDLCGHATLASAWVVFERLEPDSRSVVFDSPSGLLRVEREGGLLALDFPSRPPSPCEPPAALVEGLRREPLEVLTSRDYMAVYETEEEVRSLRPDMEALERLELLGVIVTALGKEADFVSRFFAPRVGVPEDPVTGSAHCTLVPFWAGRLRRTSLRALQVSARGGELVCEHRGSRVRIAGRATLYLEGMVTVSGESD